MGIFTSTTSRSIRVSGNSIVTSSVGNDALDGGAMDRFRIGVRGFGNELYFQGDIAEVAVWSAGTLPDTTDWTNLAAGAAPETIQSGSLVFHATLLTHTALGVTTGQTLSTSGTLATGATHPISRPDASILSGTLTLGNIVASGTLSSGSPSALSGTLTLGNIVASGSLGPAAGDWAIPALTNWSGGLQTAVTVPVVVFLGLADGSLVLALTDQTTDGSGNLSGSDASLTPGVTYMACGWNADGSARFALPVTAT
jgi:hypothetical protein